MPTPDTSALRRSYPRIVLAAHKKPFPPSITAAAQKGRTWIYDPGSIQSEIDLIDKQLQTTSSRRASLLSDASRRTGVEFDAQSATPFEDALQGFVPDGVIALASILRSLDGIQTRKEPKRHWRDADARSASKAFLSLTRQFLASAENGVGGRRSAQERRYDKYIRQAASAYQDHFGSLVARVKTEAIENRDFKELLAADIEAMRTTLPESLIKLAQAVIFEQAHIELLDDKCAEIELRRNELVDWKETMVSLWNHELMSHSDVTDAVSSHGRSTDVDTCASVIVGLFMSGTDRAIAVRSL